MQNHCLQTQNSFMQPPEAHLARMMSKESGLGGGISPVKELL